MKRNACIVIIYLLFLLVCLVAQTSKAQGCGCAPLPAPGNNQAVVTVSNYNQLQSAINNANGPTTIYLNSGTYNVGQNYVNVIKRDITIRSVTGNANDVIIQGTGMLSLNGDYHGISILNSHCTIADLTIRDIDTHPIDINFWYQPNNIDSVLIHNVHIIDGGEQLVKMSYSGNPNQQGNYGIIECSTMEYTTSLPGANDYTNGIDLHNAHNWIIRDNIIRNIRSGPQATNPAGPAIVFFKGGSDELIERNLVIDCDEGIFLGNWADNPNISNTRGIVRNNFIRGHSNSRCGLGVVLCPGAELVNNTIWSPGGTNWTVEKYSIEVTGASCTNLLIQNNIMDETVLNNQNLAPPWTDVANIDSASVTNFINVNGSNPDLHLAATSIAIGAGTPHPDRLNDIDCQLPFQAVDVGADEYNGLTYTNEENMELNITAYPNPFDREIVLEMEKNAPGNALIVIYDLLGRPVWNERREYPAGKTVERIDSQNMNIAGGTYLVCVFTADVRKTFVMIKK